MNETLRATTGTRLAVNGFGQLLSVPAQPGGWLHPWFTTPLWLPKRKAWAAFLVAGFVNGRAPMVTTTADDLRDARGTFFGQLVDAKSGEDEIAQLALLAIGGPDDSGVPGSTRIDVPLYQNPPVTLTAWRAIGWDGTERPPLFFQDRGVANPPPGVAAALQGGRINLADTEPPKGNRLLRACDIILHQPRTALSSDISIEPQGAVTGLSLVRQSLSLREPSPNDRLRLVTGTFSPQQQANLNFRGASNAIASDYEEKTWDEILLSTVYVMSPPDAPLDAKPDASWQAFVKHAAFWNLSWAQRDFRPHVSDDIFRSLVATVSLIGGGAGAFAVGWLASSINDATQGAFNVLQSQSQAGSFWTPTGGGTTGTVPVTIPDPDLKGLDKAARLAAKAAKLAAARRERRLDPAFPHEGRAFNLSLLN